MRFVPEARDGGFSPHSVRLAWILAVAYLLVIGYASLQPFQGWRPPPDDVALFLFAAWPRFITLQDVAVNFAAYLPLGLLLSVGWGARLGSARGVIAAALSGAGLSLAMEGVQMFLPSRIASNVDLLANGFGALLGALVAPLLAPARGPGGRLHAVRHRLFREGVAADVALLVTGLWLVTQFHPTAQLFGTGSFRATFDLPTYLTHTPWLAFSGEAAVVLLNLLGVGLMLSAFMRDRARLPLVIVATVGAALAIKVITAVALVQVPAPLAWLTPGVATGLALGAALLHPASRLPRAAQPALAAAALATAVVAINLAPDNPYLSTPRLLLSRSASHFLSFSSIVRALSELWPLLASAFLVYCAATDRPRQGDRL